MSLPMWAKQHIVQYKTHLDKFYRINGRYPSDEELSEALNWDIKLIKKIRNSANKYYYIADLDAPLDSNSSDDALVAFVPDDNANENTITQNIYNKALCEDVKEVLSALNEKELTFIRYIFDFDGKHYTADDVKEVMGMTERAYRRMSDIVMRKLRLEAVKRGLHKQVEISEHNKEVKELIQMVECKLNKQVA